MSAKNAGGARTRALAAAGLYFSLVFGVGLVLGPVRVLGSSRVSGRLWLGWWKRHSS
jgi:hypothetical protein